MQITPPEAIIYIPGLTQQGGKNKSIDGFAFRIKKAIDINHKEAGHRFGLEIQKRSFGYDNKLECKVATVYRYEKEEKVKVVDIYELDYASELVQKFEKQNVLVKSALLFIAMVSKFPRLLKVSLRRDIKGIPVRNKVQTFILSSILFLLSAYGVILVSALISSVGSKVNLGYLPSPFDIIHFPSWDLPEFLAVTIDCIADFFSAIGSFLVFIAISFKDLVYAYEEFILSTAAASLLLLNNLKNFVTNTAQDYLCMGYYLNYGERRLVITGKFEELLEHVCEQKEQYSNVSVHSYSFGSIIALDILFPYDGKTSERAASNIHTLVTIGCPFDFIRVYWPEYFKNRKKSDVKLTAWYNIYSGVDVLSSNFRNDSKSNEAEIRVADESPLPVNIPFNVISPENVSFLDMIMLLGLRTHLKYWDDSEYSASCFTNLFQEMKKEVKKTTNQQNRIQKEMDEEVKE